MQIYNRRKNIYFTELIMVQYSYEITRTESVKTGESTGCQASSCTVFYVGQADKGRAQRVILVVFLRFTKIENSVLP